MTPLERAEAVRKAMEIRRARLATAQVSLPFDVETIERVNALRNSGKAPKILRKALEETDTLVSEAIEAAHSKMTPEDKLKLTCYQLLANLEQGTVVKYYDEGWRFAKLCEAGREKTRLALVENKVIRRADGERELSKVERKIAVPTDSVLPPNAYIHAGRVVVEETAL